MNYLGSERFPLMRPEGLPVTKPPYGRVTAIDLDTGEVKWIVPHGDGPRDHVELKSLNLPPLGWPLRGFVLITKTLLFAVARAGTVHAFREYDQHIWIYCHYTSAPLRIFNKRNWDLVGEMTLPANTGGAPMTYNLGSQQYVVVPVGGGGVASELVALALPDVICYDENLLSRERLDIYH
jgi:quinoprotein glucose dehydrogenase